MYVVGLNYFWIKNIRHQTRNSYTTVNLGEYNVKRVEHRQTKLVRIGLPKF